MSGERQSRPRRVFLPQPAPGGADWVINDIRIGNGNSDPPPSPGGVMPFTVGVGAVAAAAVDCPETATDDDGTVVACVFTSGHKQACCFIRLGGVANICGDCGQEFQISKDDPHWSTGRGPICPNPR